ncbi:MAG TPA: ribonuclease H-like domain-containing protein [Ferruginibacter sp.]|jgi:predicted PolB exonuclease-like 3'-5' exonuclease|nr:ribonuclease H-like domain-containing protein [Ferruginibacter sp.]
MIARIPLEDFLIIDIETVSQQANFELLTDDWKNLWADKVERNLPENVSPGEYYPQRAGVMAEFSKVVCISLGYFKKEQEKYQLRVKSIYNIEERELLRSFIQTIDQLYASNNNWNFTGHNIKEFDVPFLCRRILINNLPIPPYLDFQNMKPWETNMVDTFQYWRFGDYKNYTSLKLLAAALGIPSPKDDIDGSMVGEVYWKENNIERIAAYCQKDVVTVANIVLKFKTLPLLTDQQVIFVL